MRLFFLRRRDQTRSASDAEVVTAATATPEVDRKPRVPRAALLLVSFGCAVAVIFGVWALRGVVAPVALAVVLVICVHPVRRALEGRRVPRGIAAVITVLLVVAVLAGFVIALLVALTQFTTLLPQYSSELEQVGAAVADWLAGLGVSTESADTIVAGFDPSHLVDLAIGLLGGMAGIFFGLVVIVSLVMLMAADATYLPPLLSQLQQRRPTLATAMTGYAGSVRRYMLAASGLGVLQSVLNFVALTLLGVPAPFLWALLSFICSYIPNLGYFLAIIPPAVFGLLVGGWPTAIAVIVGYGIINVIVQSVVQPRLVSNVVALNQTLTFVSVLFWTPVIGPVGAVLAVPLTLFVRAVLLDADPDAVAWRPLTGDIDEAKGLMKSADTAAREARAGQARIRRQSKADPKAP